ncbi:MAG: protease modulator HflC [Proteobacteria bacterium]|nr:protease modulator HflC [Pseudomonadota bacterium]MCP4916619.1 protease modulator HflC [Pseudomonadota bacterium]
MSRVATWIVGLAALALMGSTLYTVDAREVAVVTFFGKPVRNLTDPGLYLRAPWPLHQVTRFDRRARLLEVDAAEVLTKDKKNLVVEAFVVWRVADPEHFLETVGSPEAAETQLSDLVVSRVASSFGQREFSELMQVDGERQTLPEDVLTETASVAAERLGVEVLVVRLRHVGLPVQNEQSIYDRMRAERRRIANAYRSEGEEKAAGIRSEADRQAAEILARADQEAAGIRAEAEERSSAVYAESYAKNPELYLLLRRLEATEAILDEDAVLVVEQGQLFEPLVGE